jgi:hypothetical protein
VTVVANASRTDLTDHVRRILRQFAQFLVGVAPAPAPRLARTRHSTLA